MKDAYAERIQRGEADYGDQFDPTDLAAVHPSIHEAYETQHRVKVRMHYGEEITGTVTTTTGWRPAFMLKRRSNAYGSSDLLGRDDIVVAVLRGRRYVAC